MFRIEIQRPDLDEPQVLYAAAQWPFVLDEDGFPVNDIEVIFEDLAPEKQDCRLHVFYRLNNPESENFGKLTRKVHLTKRNLDGWLIRNIKEAYFTYEGDEGES